MIRQIRGATILIVAEVKYWLTLAMAVPVKGNGLRSVWRIGWVAWAVERPP